MDDQDFPPSRRPGGPGPDAPAWLTRTGLPARLVGHDGAVRLLGGWPRADGGRLPDPRPAAAPEAPRG